ncbi:MAG: SH3 domain-containing protein [bacterium]|nr:SH3 domain-containing protein [bacterium]
MMLKMMFLNFARPRVPLRKIALALALCALPAIFACGGEDRAAGETQSEWMFVTAKSGLRLRAEPSTSGEKIALIPPAARVEVLERSDVTLAVDGITAPWIRVRHKAFEGWVFGGYLGSESQGGDAVTERDRVFEGVWLGENLCEGRRSRIEIRADGTFEANLFGGCDVTACLCGPASGEYRIDDGRICFDVSAASYEILRRDTPTACYRLDSRSGRLVAAGDDTGFFENYGSERLTNLERAKDGAGAEDAAVESSEPGHGQDSGDSGGINLEDIPPHRRY